MKNANANGVYLIYTQDIIQLARAIPPYRAICTQTRSSGSQKNRRRVNSTWRKERNTLLKTEKSCCVLTTLNALCVSHLCMFESLRGCLNYILLVLFWTMARALTRVVKSAYVDTVSLLNCMWCNHSFVGMQSWMLHVDGVCSGSAEKRQVPTPPKMLTTGRRERVVNFNLAPANSSCRQLTVAGCHRRRRLCRCRSPLTLTHTHIHSCSYH